ncbi:hypothetical protein BDR06DRAFT_977712 [Suillus hirtellus]|nr:hypothetical protein BDR06DRAFT_977712 [Suillus hirtellus]
MYKTRIVQLSPVQAFVKQNSGQWKVVSRTAPGQDYCWVVINGNEPKIGVASSGVISDTEWPTMADHWSSDCPYHAYIPVIPNNNSFPAHGWVSNWGFNNLASCRLTLDAGKVIIQVCDNARSMMQAVLSTYKPKYAIPPNLSLAWLDRRFPTEEALATKVAEAQHHVLDQYGFIAFNIKRDPTWRTHAALSTLKDMIINTGLAECAYRGCIVVVKKIDLLVMFMVIEDKMLAPLTLESSKQSTMTFMKVALRKRPRRNITLLTCRIPEDVLSIETKHRKLPSGDVYLLFQDAPHADNSLTPIDMEDIQSSNHNPDDSTVLGMDLLPDYSSDDEGELTELEVQEMLPPVVTPGVTITVLSQTLKGIATVTIQQEPQDQAPQHKSSQYVTHNVVTVSPAPVPQVLVQLAMDLKFTRPSVMLPGINFPTTATQHTGKLVTTFRTAVRIMYLMFLNPNASPADFIPTLLRSGAPYRVLSPLGDATPHLLVDQPPYLATCHEYTGLNLNDLGYWENYKSNVKGLLGRPYARHFLSLGGILWHLALQFGLADLIDRALAGPSLDVTDWASRDMLDGFCDDMVTPADKGILLGHSLRGSETCWPPYDLWDASTEWTGRWTDDNELWFQSHLSNLSDGRLDAPKSRQVWRKLFKPAPAVISQELAHHGTDPLTHTVFGQLGHSVDCEPSWDLVQYKANT